MKRKRPTKLAVEIARAFCRLRAFASADCLAPWHSPRLKLFGIIQTRRIANVSSQTRHQTPRQAQEAAPPRQRLFPNQGQALQIRSRSGESLAALFLSRSPQSQTRFPHAMDPA